MLQLFIVNAYSNAVRVDFLSVTTSCFKMASSGFEYQYVFNVIMVGDPGVGKTSILLRIAHNKFNSYPQEIQEFVGFDHNGRGSIKVDINGQIVMLNIQDTCRRCPVSK